MELQEYGAALRRSWKTWAGVALACVLAALAVVLFSPPSYQATAQVFVASTGEGTSGSQFVNQRVTSYPDVAKSRAVLGAVINDLHLSESLATLRGQVSASNPAGTSQIDIAVTDLEPARAASIANAVAAHFGTVVEKLETPGDGTSPVELTVTNPATLPTAPSFPAPNLVLGLGLVMGISLGAAAALVRSRLDSRLFTDDEIRAAWGPGGESLTVHTAPPGRRRRGRLAAAGPVTLLARQLEPLAEQRPVRVVVLDAAADGRACAQALVHEVAAELGGWDVPVTVTQDSTTDRVRTVWSGVELVLASPLASVPEWRRIARGRDGVVLVARRGRIDRTTLCEVRSILTAADAQLLAVVIWTPRRSRRTTVPAPAAPAAAPAPAGVHDEPVLTSR